MRNVTQIMKQQVKAGWLHLSPCHDSNATGLCSHRSELYTACPLISRWSLCSALLRCWAPKISSAVCRRTGSPPVPCSSPGTGGSQALVHLAGSRRSADQLWWRCRFVRATWLWSLFPVIWGTVSQIFFPTCNTCGRGGFVSNPLPHCWTQHRRLLPELYLWRLLPKLRWWLQSYSRSVTTQGQRQHCLWSEESASVAKWV